MRLAILGQVLPLDNRGVDKTVSVLFYTISKLYPNINIYLLTNKLIKYKFAEKCIVLKPSVENIVDHDINYLVLPFNGFGIENFKQNIPNTKIISIIHDIIPGLVTDNNEEISSTLTEKNLQRRKFTQEVIDSSDIIIVPSEHTKSDLFRYLNVNKPVHTVCWAPMLTPNESENTMGLYFLYNGGYDFRKGIALMLENFIQLKIRNRLKANLILTGKYAHLNKKTDFLIKYGKKFGWVIEKGYVSDEELAGLFSNALALVYPTAYEGFGLPVLEAMNIGCPVITTKVSSIPEICKDAAYYIDRNNEDEFQEAFIQLEQNSNLRETLIKKGKEYVQDFSWEKAARTFIKLLELER